MEREIRRDSQALFSLLLGAGVAFALALSPFGIRLERTILDLHYEVLQGEMLEGRAGAGDVPPEAVVVALDDVSFDVMAEQMEGLQWPYPRSVHAQVVRNLLELGAKQIFIDILFDLPSGFGSEDDQAFADAVARGPVFLAAEETAQAVTPLLPVLENAGARPANSGLPVDIDGFIRWTPGARTLPRTSLEALFYHLGLELEYEEPTLQSPAVSLAAVDGIAPTVGLLHYAGPAGSVPAVSYFEAYDRLLLEAHREAIAGRTIFIGSTPSASITPEQAADVYFTPVGPMPGVEIHAQQYLALRAGVVPSLLLGWPVPLLLLFWLVLQCRGAVYFNRAGSGLLFAAGSALTWELGSLVAFAEGILVPNVLPLSLCVCLYVGGLLVKYFRERDERLLTRAQLFHYLPARVAEHVLAGGGKIALGGERKVLTVLFADVAGFTTLSERFSPEEVVQLLQGHLREMAEAIFANEGTLDKYLGDGIMAFWGAPQEQPNHADLALSAARDMLARVAKQNEERRVRGIPELLLRIGLHTGEALVGNIGSELFIDYTAIGDTVNTAARLEGVNKLFGTTLMLSEACADALTNPPEQLVPLGRVAVKGKAESTGILTVAPAGALGSFRRLADGVQQLDFGRLDEARAILCALAEGSDAVEAALFHLEQLAAFGTPPLDSAGRAHWPLESK
ncbi:MAG: adenylate/guanylate cyclase domain-containing protein [Bdellovibrionales bacterium]|nr:adenylate/guanylate cyclase domain-containing protein [Bdellovibrionales bacterium]